MRLNCYEMFSEACVILSSLLVACRMRRPAGGCAPAADRQVFLLDPDCFDVHRLVTTGLNAYQVRALFEPEDDRRRPAP